MEFLGWSIIFEEDHVCGFKSGTNGDLWFVNSKQQEISDYDDVGVNHISLRVEKRKDIDDVVEFLSHKNIKPLFDTPRDRPEFSASEAETYYQVMFKTIDNILFEIVYIGIK